MGQIIVPNAIKRKEGFLYYVNSSGDICEAPLAKRKKKEKELDKKEKEIN